MFHSNRCIVAVLLALGVIAAAAAGKDYFVDNKHTQASDQNPGSEDKPFKTIQAGVDVAKPGDCIWVKAGFYEGLTKISTQGRRGVPITLASWKDDHVVIGSHPKPLPRGISFSCCASGMWSQ